jgi:hypothetical protein
MSRAKTRRPGTRSDGKRRAESMADGFKPRRLQSPLALPDDLPDAAEAALDDLISSAESALSDREEPEITRQEDADDEDVARAAPIELPRKKPPPAPGAKLPAPGGRPPAPGGRPPPAPGAKRARTNVGENQPRKPLQRLQSATSKALESFEDDQVIDQVVEETVLPTVDQLQFAVFESADHLASAQGAIVAAGHVVAAGGSGPEGLAKVIDAIVGGSIDAVFVAVPGGEAAIDAALALEPRRPVVLAAVGGKLVDGIQRALAAGADLVTSRPHDIDRLAPILLATARVHAEREVAQNARGAELVLRAKLEELSDPEPRGLQPFEVFQRALELEFKRARRFEYALSVALFAVEITPPPPPAGIRGILRARVGNAIINTIRDIDLVTQLDHERFLLLLPYTDLTGAAGLGRRVIAAVAKGDPVVSAGRTFPPRVVGAVTSARPGDQLSFAKLMKDATRALDEARRDGAELAVQP